MIRQPTWERPAPRWDGLRMRLFLGGVATMLVLAAHIGLAR